MENFLIIAAIIAFCVIGVIVKEKYLKATKGGVFGAIFRNTLHKSEYTKQKEITNHHFIYTLEKSTEEVKECLKQYILGPETEFDGLLMKNDSPGFIIYGFVQNNLINKMQKDVDKRECDFLTTIEFKKRPDNKLDVDFSFAQWNL